MITDFAVPPTVAVCPECGAPLVIEVDGWISETGVPVECGVHVSCTKEDDTHYQMPYVDWLPMQKIVYAWVLQSGLTVIDWQEKLNAWNAGEPIRTRERT